MDRQTILDALHYEELTGVFTHRRGRLAGRTAGSVDSLGYVILCVDGKVIKAHRAAWLLMRGELPPVIDHINGDRLDNRIVNLRCVTPRENRLNQQRARSDSKSGYLGVVQVKNRFAAIVKVDGRRRKWGSFLTPQEAFARVVEVKRQHHGAFLSS